MVIYDLVCDLGHTFEGWFANAEDFTAQQRHALVSCPMCDSHHVEKKLSAPKLGKGTATSAGRDETSASELAAPSNTQRNAGHQSEFRNAKDVAAEKKRHYLEYQNALKTVHDYVEKNFDNVGSKFTEQAIAMHNGDLELANIRGTATAKQNKELRERGVAAVVLPRKPIDKDKLN
jgi:hypothetical protein